MNEAYRILLVDDDQEVLHINGAFLKDKGFQVVLADSAQDALRHLKKETFHCIILDVMMPGTSGLEAFSQFHELSDAPILFLTGKSEESDRIYGLMLGADDYIVKPCSLEELSLRIMINIRKQQQSKQQTGILEFPPLTIDLINRKAFYNKTEIALTNREFELLSLLAKSPGKTMTFQDIGAALFGEYLDSDRKTIMVNASRLRKKLDGYVGLDTMIETIWGKGYRFVPSKAYTNDN